MRIYPSARIPEAHYLGIFLEAKMLYLKDEVFENLVIHELNRWATEIGSERSPVRQMLGGRMFDACQKYGIKNVLALWCYGVTKTAWFSKAPTDTQGQINWCEALAAEYARLGDIRLMIDLNPDEQVTMTLVWTQASRRLNKYVESRKPVEPKLPTKPEPIPVGEKKEEPEVKRPVTKAEPEPSDKETPSKVDERTMLRRAIGSVSGAIAIGLEWVPLPMPVKTILKAIFYTLASVFK